MIPEPWLSAMLWVWMIVGAALAGVYSIAYAVERKRWQARAALTGLFLPLALPFWLAVLLWLILNGIYHLFIVAFSKEQS